MIGRALFLWGMVWLALVPVQAAADRGIILVPAGSPWKYLDTGTNQGVIWRGTNFDDSAWAVGPAPLGYGETNQATTVSFGPDPDNKYITTYFRQSFVVPDASVFSRIYLSVLRDDGVVMYLNGDEIYRNNMPDGTPTYQMLAATNVYGPGEEIYYQASFTNWLITGTNVLAAEVHQAGYDSIDLTFDLQLAASNVIQVTRGPYLQAGTPTSVLVRWRTDRLSDSRVRYGIAADRLDFVSEDGSLTPEHQVLLSGLQPDTQYFYSIGTTTAELVQGTDYFFVTAPAAGKPTRIWAIGDCGTTGYGLIPGQNQQRVRDAYYAFAGQRNTDVWLLLGDNAYPTGSDYEFQIAFFDIYPTLLRSTVLWPCIGNHETYSTYNFSDFPYLRIFSPPVNGEAGGVLSGTKRYYSFDYANIHFVCLDAMTSDRSSNGVMGTWLQQDLAANTNEWLIAFWHHPPYSKGSHDSDNLRGGNSELVQMRENVVPILEAYGVDLVLGGHSHSYERSYLLNGHYGYSWTLAPEMIKDGGTGRRDSSGPYVKPTDGPGANQGAVYVVAGSAGQTSLGPLDHPAMFISLLRLGSLVVDINGNTLEAKFLRDSGAIDDYFTIIKGASPAGFRIIAVRINNGMPTLTWNTVPGMAYQVFRRDTLNAPWLPVSPAIPASSASLSWSDIGTANPTAFYRVESVSP